MFSYFFLTFAMLVIPIFQELSLGTRSICFRNFFIQAAGLAYHHDAVVYIIKGGEPPLYFVTRWRACSCGLMIYGSASG